VRAHAAEQGIPEADAWGRAERYVEEIVPGFNVLAYYHFGLGVTRAVLNLFYKVSVDYADQRAIESLPRGAVVVYLINHRSNADYVLVGYALSGRVAISYAVGEWARIFPLDRLFKAFGSYFIRRRYREPLYHAILERYVQLISRNGVTQGIFPEGGLSRDGRLRPAKIGLLDYILGIAREARYRERLYIVPVAVNYDRVLEDRSLLRELGAAEGTEVTSRTRQLREVASYVGWNLGRLAMRRWKRYGRAAVAIGEPVPLAPWIASHDTEGRGLFDLPRAERLARVQELCDSMMERIGAIIPVTPVPLACAALQSLDADFVSRERLLSRMQELGSVLGELTSRVVHAEGDMDRMLDLALQMLLMRRVVAHAGTGFAVLPRGRALISYYANSIAHLLGPFEAGVRARDLLPALAATAEPAVS
jgi:glycerol-3-phosphate O-acyltransferase